MPLHHDPPLLAVNQEGPVAIGRQAVTHDEAFVMDKIIGMLRSSSCLQIDRGRAHDPPVLNEALYAQDAVRQLAIPNGKILSLSDKINITFGQVEIDGHVRMLSQERINDGNDVGPAKVDRRAQSNRS